MNFILFDIEATCWDGYHSNAIQEVIELGALAMNLFGEKTGTYEQMIRPVINPQLSYYCHNLTGIHQKEVDAAPGFEEVYPDFLDWTDSDIDTWFVSWGSFDPEILNAECERHFQTGSMIRNHLDLRAAYTTMKGLSRRTGLVKALSYEEIEFDGLMHRALSDTLNMGVLFTRYFDYWNLS